MTQSPWAKLNEFIEKSQSIALTAPESADGDSVGTQVALKEIIEENFQNKKVFIINEEGCPERYKCIEGTDFFLKSSEIQENPELWICVDGGPNRLGEKTTQLWEKAKFTAQIDHHKMGQDYDLDVKVVDVEAAATTKMLFDYMKEFNYPLNKKIAEAIYLGLIFDTGQFKHSNTNAEIHLIAAELMKIDFNHTHISEHSMMIKSPANLQLNKILIDSMQSIEDEKIRYAAISQNDLKNAGANEEDKDGLITTLFLTPKTQAVVLFSEKENGDWKLSFRSRGPNVAQVAKNLDSNGGGHILASGCTLSGNFESIKVKTLEAMQSVLR